MRCALLLLAVAGTVLADPRAVFPEDLAFTSNSRIVSGWEAEEGQFPFQLSLRMVNPAGGVNACGGTLIHSEWGLTAAHCTAGRVTIVVRAGTVNLTMPGAIFETTKYYNHPTYNEAQQSVVQPNDIGLLEFGRAITFTDNIRPIRLQRSSERYKNYEGQKAIASGWGRTWTQGSSPENLNWVNLAITSNEECVRAYWGANFVTESTICTKGYDDSTQSTCQGDSGGPLTIVDDDGTISQVGVTSFVSSLGCHAGVPSGFVRPGFYHDWYLEVTGVNFDWELEGTTSAPATTTEAAGTEEPDSEESDETEAPESSESQESDESQESEESPETDESQESEESPESEESEESPESEESEESEESPETEESPEPEDSDETEESPEPEDSDETEESPEPEDSEESEESPEPEDSEETEESPEPEDSEETEE